MKTSFCEISLKASYYDSMSWKRKVKNSVRNLLKQSPGGVLWRNVFPRNVTRLTASNSYDSLGSI